MTPKSVWLINKKYDMFFFGGSAVFSLLFLGLFLISLQVFDLAQHKLELAFYLVFMGVFDQPHIFQTFSRVYYDKKEFSKRKITHVLLPILLIAAGFWALYKGYYSYVAYGGAILGTFHIMKQNIGFLKMYKNINKDYHKLDNFLDIKGYYFIFIWASLLYYYDMPPWAMLPMKIGLVICGVLLVTFIARQVFLYKKQKANLPKISLFMTTLIVHGSLMFLTHLHPIVLTAIETIYHDIQYQGWMMHYQGIYFAAKKNIVSKWMTAALAYGAVSVVLYLLSETNQGLFAFLSVPFFMIIIYHYIIDGFIWKFSKDKDLKKLLPVSSE